MELPEPFAAVYGDLDIDLEKALEYAALAGSVVTFLWKRNPWVMLALGAATVAAAAWWAAQNWDRPEEELRRLGPAQAEPAV